MSPECLWAWTSRVRVSNTFTSGSRNSLKKKTIKTVFGLRKGNGWCRLISKLRICLSTSLYRKPYGVYYFVPRWWMHKAQMRFKKRPGTTNRFWMDYSTLYISSLAKDLSFRKLVENFLKLSYHNRRDIRVSSKATKSFCCSRKIWLHFSDNCDTIMFKPVGGKISLLGHKALMFGHYRNR